MAMQQQLQESELSQQDLAEVLRRAQAIEVNKITTTEHSSDIETFIRAAEEVGISREAVMQAIKEKTGLMLEGLEVGDRVFAKSADGAFYVATITALNGGNVTVHFLNGSDHVLPRTDLRAFSLLPGQRVEVNWPVWGWWNVELERYNVQKEKVTATDGFSSKNFSLAEVRLPVEKTAHQKRVSALLWRVGLVSAGIGGAIGALLMRFFS